MALVTLAMVQDGHVSLLEVTIPQVYDTFLYAVVLLVHPRSYPLLL